MTTRIWRNPKGPWLTHRHRIDVRFQEVDSLDVVWHGHYVSYFEQAREALSKTYGIGYAQFREAGMAAPVVHVSCDFLKPAVYGQTVEVITRLYHENYPRITFDYRVQCAEEQTLLAQGKTVQVLTDAEGEMLLTLPPLLKDFYEKHKSSFTESDE